MNSITLGNYTFTNDDILEGDVAMEHSAIAETLSADSLIFTIYAERNGKGKVYTKFMEWYKTVNEEGVVVDNGDILTIPYETPVYYHVEDYLYGKFYVTRVIQKADHIFKIECLSAIGLLANTTHYGGMYTGQKASVVLSEILSGLDYVVDADLANVTITGYLPVESRQDALQQVLFAIQGAVTVSNTGVVTVTSLSNQSVGIISEDRVYDGGEVVVGEAVDGVRLTEHNYFKSNDSETLFDDAIIGIQTITFDEPHHHITAVNESDANILIYPTSSDVGTNYCIVGTTGSTQMCTVTGRKYVHVERIVSAGSDSDDGNIYTIPNAYLCNPSIADALVDRVWDYVSHNKRLRQSVIAGNEKAGDVVQIVDPFTHETKQVFINTLDLAMSAVNKADLDCIIGYAPPGRSVGFEHYILIDSDTTWYKQNGYVYVGGTPLKDANDNPVAVDRIRVVCVGGGSGGNAGNEGITGNSTEGEDFTQGFSGGDGGDGGIGGMGGKIFELSFEVEDGDSGSITIGQGGTGATAGGETPATNGGDTAFVINGSSYSSLAGKRYEDGYTDTLSHITVAEQGPRGTKGAAGGHGAPLSQATVYGDDGDDYPPSYSGGAGSASQYTVIISNDYYYVWEITPGNGGGGAANGSDGGDASTDGPGVGGNGGPGDNANYYGCGGQGGHGGGGGGGGGGGYSYNHAEYPGVHTNPIIVNGIVISPGINVPADYHHFEYPTTKPGGAGGIGGAGGNGYQGCLIMYY